MQDAKSKFPPEVMNTPLFLGDVRALSDKLHTARGLLGDYWKHYQQTFMQEQDTRDEMIFLPAALSEELRDEAKGLLKSYYLGLRESDTAGDVQFHTWCRCGSVTRRAAFFDWFAASGAWSQNEIEEAAECFLGFAFKHPFAVLNIRGRSSNNQALSMAVHLAVVGFLFGYKLTNHPTGKFLFDYGLGRLPDLIGLFPEDGYAGEGSTYTSDVNTPLAYWTCELLRQLTGRDFLDVPFKPNGTTLRKLLEIELRLLSPGGLLAPWDHYGWQRGMNASAFAYLARVTGNPRYLSLIPSLDLWDDPGYLAWGRDDPMWTLIWWPEEQRNYADAELPDELFGWFLPKTGAALDDPKRRTRLMQVWDLSASTVAGVGRAQVNPNHLMMDSAGEPVFQDGIPEKGNDPWHFPVEEVLAQLSDEARERYLYYLNSIGAQYGNFESVVAASSPGLVGAANAVVVDEEGWYWPGESRVGKGEFYAAQGGLQVVTSDSAAFYRPRYDVGLVRRTSLWTEEGFGVVLDTLDAASEHTWRWQVHLRPDVAVGESAARVNLPNGTHVLLAWEPGPEVRSEVVEGFPRTEEGRSVRLDLVKKGRAARFAVVIAPGAQQASIAWVGEHSVEVTVDGATHRLAVENFRGERVPVGQASTAAAFAWQRPDGSTVRISEGLVDGVKPDVYDLSDIKTDRDLQLPEFERLVAWSAAPREAGDTRLSQIDACLCQLPADKPDVAALFKALRCPHWPVQIAAAEVLGARGCAEAAPILRELLEAEHAIPEQELYPPEDAVREGAATEDLAKRWRVKAALSTALGRLGDRDAVPVLARILADGRDFYGAYSVAAQALGRIGGAEAVKALDPALTESEVNTRYRAITAKQSIESES